MTEPAIDPFDVVAGALGCARRSLSPESGMYRTHGWDSLGHISVIVALQEAYGFKISNDEMMRLDSMESIVEFCRRFGTAAST